LALVGAPGRALRLARHRARGGIPGQRAGGDGHGARGGWSLARRLLTQPDRRVEAVEGGEGGARDLERDAQGRARLLAVVAVDEGEHVGGVELVAQGGGDA